MVFFFIFVFLLKEILDLVLFMSEKYIVFIYGGVLYII